MSPSEEFPIGSVEYYESQIGSLKKLQNIPVNFPDFPTELNFLLVRHYKEEDLPDNIDELLTGSDVLILEGLCWYPENAADWRAVSEGDETAISKVSYSHFQGGLAKVVLGTGIPVRYCDIPNTKKNRADVESLDNPPEPLEGSNPRHVIAIQKNSFENWFKTVWLPRERYMLKNIFNCFPTPTEEDVATRGLFIVGAAHKTVSDTIRWQIEQAGISHVHQVNDIPHYDLQNERFKVALYREYIQGKRMSDVLLGRMMIEGVTISNPLLSETERKLIIDRINTMQIDEILTRIEQQLQLYRVTRKIISSLS